MRDFSFTYLKIIIPFLFLLSCEIMGPGNSIVYYNSFENADDLDGWEGLTETLIRDDGAPGGGNHSILISGGCIIPHAAYRISDTDKDQYVTFSFYGKSLTLGGTVTIFTGNPDENSLSIFVADSVWTKYEATGRLHWPADSSLNIWMNCGGFVAGAMLIDELYIQKAE